MGRKRSKTQKAKTKPIRPARKKSRPAAGAAKKSAAGAAKKSPSEVARELDQVVRDFDGAAEGLQISLEKLRGTLPELIDIEVRRYSTRRMKVLAADGILDSLQRLATVLEECGRVGALPESLLPIHLTARMTIDHLCSAFDVQAVYQPGELITVTQEQLKDFDWSADRTGELNFPVHVEILRSGWKAGDAVFVLPKAVRRG